MLREVAVRRLDIAYGAVLAVAALRLLHIFHLSTPLIWNRMGHLSIPALAIPALMALSTGGILLLSVRRVSQGRSFDAEPRYALLLAAFHMPVVLVSASTWYYESQSVLRAAPSIVSALIFCASAGAVWSRWRLASHLVLCGLICQLGYLCYLPTRLDAYLFTSPLFWVLNLTIALTILLACVLTVAEDRVSEATEKAA